MSEKEIKDAIAAQEEHIKRVTSCQGRLYVSHQWQWGAGGGSWEECVRCGVTKSPRDYDFKLRAQGGESR